MIKTGKSIGFVLSILLSFTFSAASAQEITVSASLTETNIFAGESVRLNIVVSGQSLNSIDRPQMPSVDGLRWLSGSTSQSTNYSYVNGRPSVSYTYGYVFIAQTPGEYLFPSLSVSVNGEQFTTQSIRFNVLNPETVDPTQAQRSPDIYVRLEPSTSNPVVGEQVIADIVLYFKSEVEVSNYQPTSGWKAEGFWKEELENQRQARTTSTIINGVRYQRARLLQYAIFPTKSGELTLSPYEIVVQVRNRNQRRDIFSFGLGQERMELNTLPVTIDVRPLPSLNNATSSGAVGTFEITRSITPDKAFVGESVEITTTIRGQGNIPLIVKPEFEFPEALEQYDPQETTNITRANRQIAGTKTFTDIVIARNEGRFEIPEVSMAYYNPQRERFETIRLPALTLEAERDPRATPINTNELRFDVEPITGLANWTSPSSAPIYSRPWAWGMLLTPFFLLGVAFAFKTYSDKMNTDTAFARSQKARDKAMQELDKVHPNGDIKTGYFHIEKSLSQFISDKLDLPKAGLSHQKLIKEVKEKAGSTLSNELKRLLNKCETITYAPNPTQEGLKSDLTKAEELIKTLGKSL
ncbi:MAG: BatD family protein [Balneolales bacterium]|nr:BatD family protein [Balneolales bacterium]